jgi:hypothetical protein
MRENTGLTRIGEPWTNDEEMKVLSSLANSKTIEEISNDIQRTCGAIRSRLKHISVEMHIKGVKHEDITHITTITSTEINEAIEKRRKKEETPNKTDTVSKTQSITKTDFMEMKCLLYEIRDLLKKIANY